MRPHEPTPTPPAPKPPATGGDAWKNQPTNCWPTPEQMAQLRERGAGKPTLVREGDSVEQPQAHAAADVHEAADAHEAAEDTWEGEGGADEPDDIDQGQGPDSRQTTRPDDRPPLSADPDIPQGFRETVARLDDVAERPVAEHAEAYDAVHRDLRQSLDDVDQSR